MRRGVVELVLVLVVVAVSSFLMQRAENGASASRPPADGTTPIGCGKAELPLYHLEPGTVTSHGIRPGMTAERVHEILGPSPKGGPLQVKGGQGRWEEYGTPGPACTWEGHPSVTYTPEGTVLCVLGTSVEVAGKGQLEGDDLTPAGARTLLGSEDDPANPLQYLYREDGRNLTLVVFPSGRKHVAFSQSPSAPRTLFLTTPSPHGFRTGNAENPPH